MPTETQNVGPRGLTGTSNTESILHGREQTTTVLVHRIYERHICPAQRPARLDLALTIAAAACSRAQAACSCWYSKVCAPNKSRKCINPASALEKTPLRSSPVSSGTLNVCSSVACEQHSDGGARNSQQHVSMLRSDKPLEHLTGARDTGRHRR